MCSIYERNGRWSIRKLKEQKKLFSHVEPISKNILAIQSSSVARKISLFCSAIIFLDRKSVLKDDIF